MRVREAALAALVLVALAVGLAACGGGGGGGETEGAGATAGTATVAAGTATAAAGNGTRVTVTETEFELALSQTSFTPGTYTFVVENTGSIDHALEVEGQGLEEETETIAPGSSAELTVTLEAGTYELYCPVGNHRDQGMTLDVDVS